MSQEELLALSSRIADHENRIRELTAIVNDLKNDDRLINAYAHGNIHRAMLRVLVVGMIKRDNEPSRAMQQFYNDVCDAANRTVFPRNDPKSSEIKSRTIEILGPFFREIEDILVRTGKMGNQERFLANACPDNNEYLSTRTPD
jgi:hypothetical protein